MRFQYTLSYENNEHQKLIPAYGNMRKIPRAVRVTAREEMGLTTIGWFYLQDEEENLWILLSPNAESGGAVKDYKLSKERLKGTVPAACVKPHPKISQLQEYFFIGSMFNSRYMPLKLRTFPHDVAVIGSFTRAKHLSTDTSGWVIFSPSKRNWAFVSDDDYKKHDYLDFEAARVVPDEFYGDYRTQMCGNCAKYDPIGHVCTKMRYDFRKRRKKPGLPTDFFSKEGSEELKVGWKQGRVKVKTSYKCEDWVENHGTKSTYTKRK